jgi:Spy/CpxP family protein refolding chaperone
MFLISKYSRGATIAALLFATMASPPSALAQLMPPGNEQHSMSGVSSPKNVSLTQQITQLRSRLAQIQAAFDKNHRDGSVKAGVQPVGMGMEDQMGMGSVPNKPAMSSKGMPPAAGCCSGMMGKMGAAGATSTTMPSDLPGFPGASHIYHIGASGFFLDYSAALKLTTNQQVALNGIRERSIGAWAAAQRQIEQAEQELWMLTSSDEPDSMALTTKVRDIEKLRGDQRIAFIRSVGEAARILTDDQRAALLGTGAPAAEQTAAPQGSTGSVKPQGGIGSTDPKAGMGDDSMGSMGGGKKPNTKGKDETGDM